VSLPSTFAVALKQGHELWPAVPKAGVFGVAGFCAMLKNATLNMTTAPGANPSVR
jgi:hypothetical protein